MAWTLNHQWEKTNKKAIGKSEKRLLVSLVFCLMDWCMSLPVGLLLESTEGHSKGLIHLAFTVLHVVSGGEEVVNRAAAERTISDPLMDFGNDVKPLNKAIGNWCFVPFIIFLSLFLAFFWRKLPETKGKSYADIARSFGILPPNEETHNILGTLELLPDDQQSLTI